METKQQIEFYDNVKLQQQITLEEYQYTYRTLIELQSNVLLANNSRQQRINKLEKQIQHMKNVISLNGKIALQKRIEHFQYVFKKSWDKTARSKKQAQQNESIKQKEIDIKQQQYMSQNTLQQDIQEEQKTSVQQPVQQVQKDIMDLFYQGRPKRVYNFYQWNTNIYYGKKIKTFEFQRKYVDNQKNFIQMNVDQYVEESIKLYNKNTFSYQYQDKETKRGKKTVKIANIIGGFVECFKLDKKYNQNMGQNLVIDIDINLKQIVRKEHRHNYEMVFQDKEKGYETEIKTVTKQMKKVKQQMIEGSIFQLREYANYNSLQQKLFNLICQKYNIEDRRCNTYDSIQKKYDSININVQSDLDNAYELELPTIKTEQWYFECMKFYDYEQDLIDGYNYRSMQETSDNIKRGNTTDRQRYVRVEKQKIIENLDNEIQQLFQDYVISRDVLCKQKEEYAKDFFKQTDNQIQYIEQQKDVDVSEYEIDYYEQQKKHLNMFFPENYVDLSIKERHECIEKFCEEFQKSVGYKCYFLVYPQGININNKKISIHAIVNYYEMELYHQSNITDVRSRFQGIYNKIFKCKEQYQNIFDISPIINRKIKGMFSWKYDDKLGIDKSKQFFLVPKMKDFLDKNETELQIYMKELEQGKHPEMIKELVNYTALSYGYRSDDLQRQADHHKKEDMKQSNMSNFQRDCFMIEQIVKKVPWIIQFTGEYNNILYSLCSYYHSFDLVDLNVGSILNVGQFNKQKEAYRNMVFMKICEISVLNEKARQQFQHDGVKYIKRILKIPIQFQKRYIEKLYMQYNNKDVVSYPQGYFYKNQFEQYQQLIPFRVQFEEQYVHNIMNVDNQEENIVQMKSLLNNFGVQNSDRQSKPFIHFYNSLCNTGKSYHFLSFVVDNLKNNNIKKVLLVTSKQIMSMELHREIKNRYPEISIMNYLDQQSEKIIVDKSETKEQTLQRILKDMSTKRSIQNDVLDNDVQISIVGALSVDKCLLSIKYDLIIIDEVCDFCAQFQQEDFCKEKQEPCKLALIRMFRQAKKIMMFDSFLTVEDVSFLENTFQLDLDLSSIYINQYNNFIKNDIPCTVTYNQNKLVNKSCDYLLQGKKFTFSGDSRKQLLCIREIMQSKCSEKEIQKKIIIFAKEDEDEELLQIRNEFNVEIDTQDQIMKQQLKEFVENPQEFYNKYQPDVILYSPKISQALNIKIKEMTIHFHLYNEIINEKQSMQQIFRNRFISELHVALKQNNVLFYTNKCNQLYDKKVYSSDYFLQLLSVFKYQLSDDVCQVIQGQKCQIPVSESLISTIIEKGFNMDKQYSIRKVLKKLEYTFSSIYPGEYQSVMQGKAWSSLIKNFQFCADLNIQRNLDNKITVQQFKNTLIDLIKVYQLYINGESVIQGTQTIKKKIPSDVYQKLILKVKETFFNDLQKNEVQVHRGIQVTTYQTIDSKSENIHNIKPVQQRISVFDLQSINSCNVKNIMQDFLKEGVQIDFTDQQDKEKYRQKIICAYFELITQKYRFVNIPEKRFQQLYENDVLFSAFLKQMNQTKTYMSVKQKLKISDDMMIQKEILESLKDDYDIRNEKVNYRNKIQVDNCITNDVKDKQEKTFIITRKAVAI